MIPLFSDVVASEGLDLVGAVRGVIDRHWYVLGKEVTGFEQEFAAHVGVDHCVSVANGTDALEIVLRAFGVGPGDRVVAAANAGFYGSTAIHSIGATPVYVDVEADRLTLSPAALEQALALSPKCVIVTHLYGQMADMPALQRLCRAAGVPLLEDCAQSHGAQLGGRRAGSWGEAACFSFYPTKNLGALGDGGAITTGDGEFAARTRQLRQYGWSTKYQVSVPGGRNSRLDEMQAAILRAKLPRLDQWNAQRRAIARRYNEAFASLPLQLPASTGEDHAAHLYVLRTPRRAELRAFLHERGIATDVHYPTPDHRQPAHPNATCAGAMTHTESACEQVLSLPCFPGLPGSDVEAVVDAVSAFFRG